MFSLSSKPLCGNLSGCLQGWEEQAQVGTTTPDMSREQKQPRPQSDKVRLECQLGFPSPNCACIVSAPHDQCRASQRLLERLKPQ